MVMEIVVPDTSEIDENELIRQQLKGTVQDFPNAVKETGGRIEWGSIERKALLAPRGNYRRLNNERYWYYREDNTLFRAAISGLTKRVQSLPYEIKADKRYGDYWDDFVRFANFDDWETFVGELVLNYSVYSTGAFIEIIAPGNPLKEPTSAATGMAILDTRNCWLTGDPMYPVIYNSSDGSQHLMHRSRVVQLVDMEEKNDSSFGWGDSALARCISPIYREILMARYMSTTLDDQPAPGFAVAKNLAGQQVMDAVRDSQARREQDEDIFGRLIFLYGADTNIMPELEFQQFQKTTSDFNFESLSTIDAKMIAAGVGIDIQDFWELSGGNIGSAAQSQIIDQKSKGRALGRLIKGIERIINDIVPDDVDFEFKYRNEEEDLQRAQTAQAWGQFVVGNGDILTADEQRIILANQVDAVKDAITDEEGQVLRWDDVSPQDESQANQTEQIVEPDTGAVVSDDDETPEENLTTGEQKDFRQTRASFVKFWDAITKGLKAGRVTPAQAQSRMMSELNFHGREAWVDGMLRAGAPPLARAGEIGEDGAREIASWTQDQRGFVSSYIENVTDGNLSDKQLSNRGIVWANKSLEELMYKAMDLTAPRKMWRWVTNFAKENCRSCLRLHNQVHTMAAYVRSGFIPKANQLNCHGDNCGCGLASAETGSKARGRLSSVPKG